MTQESSSSIPPAGQTDYIYYAFVSYSHKDGKWAKWIQNALERYRLPAAVRREAEKPLPIRIHPVFRDSTDLGVGKLAETLRKELEQSKYLIVVCSPNSARPNEEGKHWVNEEVARFCELGHADRIIPVIVEGTKETACCPKLVEEDILGLDATKHPKARILNDLVAKILGLRPDELWRREERRSRSKRRWHIFFASLTITFLALAAHIVWDCTRTVTRAFADYVDSYGLPEGIFPLTKEQVSLRHVHYRFEFRGYRCEWFGKSIHADSAAPSILRALGFRRILKRVCYSENVELFQRERIHVASLFQMQRPFKLAFRYTARGNLAGTTARNASGKDIYIAFDRKENNTFIRFANPTTGVPVETPVAIFGLPDGSGTGNGVFAWKARYDGSGRLAEILYVNPQGKTVNDSRSNSGLEFSTDKQGRVTETRLKGRADGVVSGKNVKVQFVHTENPKRLEFHACEETDEGKTIQYALVAITFDNGGRPVSVRFPPREPGIGKLNIGSYYNGGYEGAWDSRDIQLERRYDLTQYTTRESGPTGWDSRFDDRGNEVARRFVDAEGKPAMTDYGYAGWNSEFDNQGHETMRVCVGLDGKPLTVEAGPAGWTRRFSDTNVVFSYVDAALKPVFCRRKHYASRETAFDSDGNEVFRVYRDAGGKPRLQPEGYAAWKSEYDANGNDTNTVFLGNTLLPADQPEGYAGYSTRFDAFGRAVSRRFFDSQGKPCSNRDGYAGWDKQYDLAGQETNRVYVSENGELALVEKNGLDEKTGPVAGWWKRYSADGDLLAIGTLGTNKLPMLNQLGWASKQFVKNGELWFDEHGESIFHPHPPRITRKTFGSSPFEKTTWWLDEETGERVKGEDGAFGYRELFNEVGECTNKVHLGADGAPCMSDDGYAECRTEYGAQYKPTRTAYYDTEENLVTNQHGYAFQIETWDEHGKDTSTQWYDAEGRLVERYPDEGVAYRLYEFFPPPWAYQESSVTFIGTNGVPVNNSKGYSRIVYDADSNYQWKGSLYYRADGTPFHFKGGHSGFMEYRDHHYNTTNFVYLGADGKPFMNTEKGMASYTTEYDYSLGWLEKERLITAQFFFDAGGNPIAKKTGEAGWRDEFDDYGRQTERTYFGTNGKPVMTTYGFATRKMFYDETTGAETNRVLLDANGEVIPPKEESKKKKYSWKPHYNEDGLLAKETYETEDGTLGRDSLWSKASSVEYKYDDRGHETNRIYRGLQGEPVLRGHFAFGIGTHSENSREKWLGESDYSELRCQYNADGLLAEKSFWGTNGDPIESSSGSHIIRYAYNSSGKLSEESHFTTNGVPCLNASGYHIRRFSYGEDGSDKAFYFDVDGSSELCNWEVSTIESADLSGFDPEPDIQPGDIVLKRQSAHILPLEDYSASFSLEWKDLITRSGAFISSSREKNWGKRIGEDEWAIAPIFILARKDIQGYEYRAFTSNSLLLWIKECPRKQRLPLEEGKKLAYEFGKWLSSAGKDDIIEIKSKANN